MSQNLNGETLVGHISLAADSDLSSHDVHVTITTTHTNVTLDDNSCKLGTCHVTLRQTVTGQDIYLNEALYIAGVSNKNSYLRSKLSTFSGFTGCLGVSKLSRERGHFQGV